MTERELLTGALPLRWTVSYLAFCAIPLAMVLIPFGLFLGSYPFKLGVSSSRALLAATAGAFTAFAVGLTVCAVMTWILKRQLRHALAGLESLDDIVLLAVAYHQVKSRYRRRPPGVLVVTSTHLSFVPKHPKDAEHGFRWDLAQVEAAAPTGDRFGLVSRAFDIQGAVELRHEGTPTVISVIGCHHFFERFQEIWGARLANART